MAFRDYIPFGAEPPAGAPPTDDAFKDPITQIGEGYNQTFAPLIAGGLGLGQQGAQAIGQAASNGLAAITPSQDTLYRIFAGLEAGGAAMQGRTPLFMQQQDLHNQMQLRRDALVQQLAAQQETRDQHYREMTMKLIDNGNYEGLKAFGEQYTYQPAINLSQGLAQSDLARLPGLMAKGYLTQEDVDLALSSDPSKRLGANAIRQRVKFADQMDMEDEKANAKQNFIRNAMNMKAQGKPLTPAQASAIADHETQLAMNQGKIELDKATTQEKLALAQKHLHDVQMGPGDKGLGHDREAITMQLFASKYGPQVHYSQLQPAEMQHVNDQLAQLQGAIQYNRSTGSQRAQLEVPDKLTPTERENESQSMSSIGLVDNLSKLYSDEFIGPIRGRFGSILEAVGGMGEDEAELRADLSTLKNGVIKAITGAQMGEAEATRIMRQIPDANNPPEVFSARLKSTRKNLVTLAQKRRDTLKASGIDTSQLPPIPGSGNGKVKSAIDSVLGGQ